MNNKVLLGVGLIGLAGVAAYFAFKQNTPSYNPPANLPGGSTPILPGQSYGGVVNSSSDAIWLTATGQLVNSLGQAFSSIYTAVQSNPGGSSAASAPATS